MKNKDHGISGAYREIRRLRRNLSNAKKELKKSLSAFEKSELIYEIADIKIMLAWLLLDYGEYSKGIALYQTLSWRTHGEEKYNGMSRALIEMQHFDDARRLLEKGLKRYPKSTPLHVAMGLLNYRLGHELDALRYFESALKYAPDDRHALYDKALALNSLGYYEDSYPILKDLVENYSDDPEYLIEMGYTHLSMGHPEDAIPFYQKAKDTGYLSPSIYGGLYCSYIEMGMKNEALEIATEGLREFNDVSGMYENLSHCYFKMGWIDEAKTLLNEAIKKFPEEERLKTLLKEIEDETDDPDKGKNPPALGLIFLLMLLKKLRERSSRK